MKENMKEMYLVLFNGLAPGEYGVKMSLLGVYDTREKADESLKTLPEEIRTRENRYEIKKVVLNSTLAVTKDPLGNYKTEIECGSYIE